MLRRCGIEACLFISVMKCNYLVLCCIVCLTMSTFIRAVITGDLGPVSLDLHFPTLKPIIF